MNTPKVTALGQRWCFIFATGVTWNFITYLRHYTALKLSDLLHELKGLCGSEFVLLDSSKMTNCYNAACYIKMVSAFSISTENGVIPHTIAIPFCIEPIDELPIAKPSSRYPPTTM